MHLRGCQLWLVLAVIALWITLAGCGGSTHAISPADPASNGGSNAGSSHAPNATTISNLQNLPGWQWCSATINGGYPCASGIGNAVSWMTQRQSQPSLDGASAQIYLGGSTPYSNALWWKELDVNTSATHFDYDLWIYSANPGAAQALEFDVNQSFNGTRWVYGTECNIYAGGHWDVWDSSGQWGRWVSTDLGCPVLQPNTWAHLVWHFERSGNQVHYISLTVNGTDYPVDVWTAAQTGWNSNELNVAVQLDGNFRQEPYSLYLDQMALTYW